ncbi:MAG: SUMF1/EgtB/PvdO family nonheme iron enzyme [Anaerolineae bacterium]|nr:SUMF1/EgtB/PvdO family nonheme iron enzyme [Anaerolineae bacterium]
MARAFISYRRVDSAALATLIAMTLSKQHGIETYVDTRNTDGGGAFPDRLRRAIAESDVFICLLGETSLESAWVLEEIEHAYNLRKTMIPVFQERYSAPKPPPNAHVEALLQSDGVQILDVRNVYVDQAIAAVADMIKKSVPQPRLRLAKPLMIVAVLIVLAVALVIGLPQLSSLLGDAPSATREPGYEPVTRNADWTPIAEDFNGVTMMLVPVGCFTMGNPEGEIDQIPAHEQCFDEPFWIDEVEVTNAQFARFNGRADRSSEWSGDDQPRERITWLEARDFCTLRGARLPTEREWEYAARGPDSLLFPWGDRWDADKAIWWDNANEQSADVGSIPAGASWVGALDMSGNVWEWVSSIYMPYPYAADDGREQNSNDMEVYRGLRGGAWDQIEISSMTSTYRNDNTLDYETEQDGFRCARSA